MSNLRALWLLLALAGCGSGASTGPYNQPPPGQPPPPPPPPPPGGPSGQAAVTMAGSTDQYGAAAFSFNPVAVTISRPGTVTWSNGTGVLHTVTFAPATGAPSDIASFDSGSASRTFSTAGTFNYRCTNHAEMTGQVVVQ